MEQVTTARKSVERYPQTWLEASSRRFDYWYSETEIDSLVQPVESPASQAAAVHVVFNTNFEDQGQVNARLMMQALKARKAA